MERCEITHDVAEHATQERVDKAKIDERIILIAAKNFQSAQYYAAMWRLGKCGNAPDIILNDAKWAYLQKVYQLRGIDAADIRFTDDHHRHPEGASIEVAAGDLRRAFPRTVSLHYYQVSDLPRWEENTEQLRRRA